MPTLRSSKFTVGVRQNGNYHKLFKIIFHYGKKSGNCYLMIDLPYFAQSKGLLSQISSKNEESLSLIPGGKVTSKRVKFNHPLDGNVHFSSDGKIYTRIRNQARRLDNSIGHLFTIQLQGIDDFKISSIDQKRNRANEIDLDFDLEEDNPEAIKFVGFWYKVTDIRGSVIPGKKTPKFVFRDGSYHGFVVAPAQGFPLSNYVLLLSGMPITSLNNSGKPIISFIGGFSEANQGENLTFLGCIYPCEDYESLLQNIGSVDYPDELKSL